MQNGPPWKKSPTGSGARPASAASACVAVILGAAGGAVAVGVGARVVPPGALVHRDAVEDLVAQIRVLQPDAHELQQILRAQPDRQPAAVHRRIGDVADAQAEHAQAVLVGVERAQPLAEDLAHAVAAVGPHRHVGADAAVARVEAHRVVGGGEHHALHALAARGLEQVVAADDVGLQDRLPRPFHREAAQMHDAVDTVHDRLDLLHDGEVRRNEDLVGGKVRRGDDVGEAQLRIDRRQQPAQPPPHPTCSTRQQYASHRLAPFA